MLKEVCAALLEADVNIHLVKRLRENVKFVEYFTLQFYRCTDQKSTSTKWLAV